MDPFRLSSDSCLLVLTGGVPNCGFEIDDWVCVYDANAPPANKKLCHLQ